MTWIGPENAGRCFNACQDDVSHAHTIVVRTHCIGGNRRPCRRPTVWLKKAFPRHHRPANSIPFLGMEIKKYSSQSPAYVAP
eukprot:scaffold233416_cov18-Prasinocladus_malaysianus.AAC.1